MLGPTQNLGPIGSAVLMFIGYKQTKTKTIKLNLYIDIYIGIVFNTNLKYKEYDFTDSDAVACFQDV